jgi:uncharacterized protein YcfL
MHRFTVRLSLFVIVVLLILAGCSSSAQNGAAKAVEGYLQAVTAQDINKASSLSCANWESSAQLEVDSFSAVTAKLDGLSCKETGTDGKFTLVSCQGKIVTTYNNENQEINLAGRVYQAVQESGEWRMCGYK